MPARRTLFILAIGAGFFALAGVSKTAFYVGLSIDVVVLTLFVIDRRHLPRAGRVRIERRHPRVFPLGQATKVCITISNDSPQPLRGILQDNPSGGLQPAPGLLDVNVPPHAQVELGYTLRPYERGRFSFHPGVLRAFGPLSMSLREYRFPELRPKVSGAAALDHEFTVYPTVSSATPRRVAAFEQRAETGYHRLRRHMEGTAPAYIREYVQGDSYRHIHWKATSRYDHPMVTQFDVDTNQSIYIFVDCGRLTRVPVGPLRKLDYAINACADLARVAIEEGDTVGVCCFSNRIKVWHEAKGKRAHFLKILESLAMVSADNLASNYHEPVNMFLSRVKRRSLCLFITTLSESESTWELMRRLITLRPRHVPAVVSLADPALEAALREPPTDFEDACRKLAAADLREEVELFAHELRKRQGYFLDVPADALSLSAIQTYLDAKTKGLL